MPTLIGMATVWMSSAQKMVFFCQLIQIFVTECISPVRIFIEALLDMRGVARKIVVILGSEGANII